MNLFIKLILVFSLVTFISYANEGIGKADITYNQSNQIRTAVNFSLLVAIMIILIISIAIISIARRFYKLEREQK